MASIVRRQQTNIKIEDQLRKALQSHAADRRVTMTAVVEQALRSFLQRASEERRDAPLASRLKSIDDRLAALKESNKLQLETMGVLIQFLLGILPEPITEDEHSEFVDKSRRRFSLFIDEVTRVSAGKKRGLHSQLQPQEQARSDE